MLGEGEAVYRGALMGGGEALSAAGLRPVELGAKEGLALVNGTHLMASRGALVMCGVRRLMDAALVAAAMSVDGARATDRVFDDRIHASRNQVGQMRVARRVASLLSGSEIGRAHREGDPRVQDPYSFRCVAQVLGASWDALDHAGEVIERELGAVTDNPLVFDGDGERGAEVLSGGNFHGMPVAMAMDHVAIALSHVAGMAERRVFYLLAASDPENPINPHLSRNPGVQSGLMMTQYAAAACCNELVGLSNPASVANLSTCAGMEDYNSFGPRSAAKAERALRLCERVVATELVVAAEAIEYQRPLRSSAAVEGAHATVRGVVAPFEADRPPGVEIERVAGLIRAGRFG
jgi:histidine ammonia-lyase